MSSEGSFYVVDHDNVEDVSASVDAEVSAVVGFVSRERPSIDMSGQAINPLEDQVIENGSDLQEAAVAQHDHQPGETVPRTAAHERVESPAAAIALASAGLIGFLLAGSLAILAII